MGLRYKISLDVWKFFGEKYGKSQCMKLLVYWLADRAAVLTVQLLSGGRLVCGAQRGISDEQWL